MSFSALPIFDTVVGPDVSEYHQRAQEILRGFFFADDVQIHGPAYPFFLAALLLISAGNYFLVRALQMGLCYAAGFFFYAILARSFHRGISGPRRYIPECFLLIWTFYPPLIAHQAEFYSENLCWLFLAPTAWLLSSVPDSGRRAWLLLVAAGCLGGCAVVTHPAAGLILVLVAFWLFLRERTMRGKGFLQAVVFCTAVALPVLPVTINNYRLAGEFIPVQRNSGLNFYLGNNPDADGTCYVAPGVKWARLHEEADNSGMGRDAYFFRQAGVFLRDNPGKALILPFRKAALSFSNREWTTWSDVACLNMTWLHRYAFSLFALIGVPAMTFLCMRLTNKKFRRDSAVFLLFLCGMVLPQLMFVTSGRYRITMVPVVMVFSAMFAGTLPLWLHLARKRPWVRFRLLVLLLLFAGVSLIPFSFPGAALERAKAQGNLAEALLEKGDCARAAALLENAGADTESARSLNLYGRALLKLGRPQEAVLVFERAIPLFPRDHFSYMNLATTLASLGRVENVPMLFERAESLAGPSDRPEVWYNLGTVLMNAGDSDAAAVLFRRIERDHKHAPKALNYLGIIALEKSQFSDAAGFFREAAALVPNEPSYKVNLAVALCEAGALEEAKGILLDVLRTHPDDIQARGLYSDYFSGTPSSAP